MEFALNLSKPCVGLTQITLERKRSFAGRLSASDCGIVKGFTGRSKEPRVGMLAGKIARLRNFFNDVTIAQLGQDSFKRVSKAVEYTNDVAQRSDAGASIQFSCCGFVFAVSGTRMDKKCSAAIDSGFQQFDSFVCCIPASTTT